MSPEVAVLQRMQDVAPTARMYLLKLPQAPQLPAAVVQLIDNVKPSHLRGGSNPGRARVQVTVYRGEGSGIDPYNEAEVLMDTIHGDDAGSGLAGFTGVMGGSPGGLLLEEVRFLDRRAAYEPDEREVGLQEDYWVWFRNL